MIWIKENNLISYPYGWQRPAKTEEWAFECCKNYLYHNEFIHFFCFPWATLIDFTRRGKNNIFLNITKALDDSPPKNTLIRATFCQHIYALDILPWLKKLKITDLFWSHATKELTKVDGVRIHPFPLYPVCYGDPNISHTVSSNNCKRNFLFSFIGSYQPELYISKARRWIFDLPKQPDAIVEQTSEWFFEGPVYRAQIDGRSQCCKGINNLTHAMTRYKNILENSIFSLCPSGSGPNTIRLWESLLLGCIPVLISDNLRLPGEELDWRNSIVFIKEDQKSINQIPHLLRKIANNKDNLETIKNNCRKMLDAFDIKLLTKPLFKTALPSYLNRNKLSPILYP